MSSESAKKALRGEKNLLENYTHVNVQRKNEK